MWGAISKSARKLGDKAADQAKIAKIKAVSELRWGLGMNNALCFSSNRSLTYFFTNHSRSMRNRLLSSQTKGYAFD